MMSRIVKVVLTVPAVLFIVMGIRWLVDPAGIAPEFGLSLAEGVGRSTLVGDMSSFFLTLGGCILLALVSGRRVWLYPAAALLLIAAIGRLLAWLLHDAALATSMIAVEVVVGGLLLIASRWLTRGS